MAYTKAQLEAIKNSLLANASDITASEHRQVEQAIIDEMYDAQTRADLFAALSTYVSPLGTDKLFIFRSGVAGLIEASVLDFVQNFVDLQDVNINAPSDDAIVYYNASQLKFEAKLLSDFPITYNANEVRDALESLTLLDRLDASAIKNLPSDTAVQTVNSITPTAGDVTLDADDIAETTARKWTSTAEKTTWNAKYDTPNAVRDALQSLTLANRLDASAIKNLPAGVSGEFLRKNITLTAHGFVVKDVLTVNGSGVIVKVTNTITQKAIGVVRSVIDVNNFELVINGFIDGLSGLTVGSIHYANNSGTLVTTVSDIQVLIAISATSGFMLSSGGSAAGVNPTSVSASVSTGTMTLDFESKKRKKFVATVAISANFSLAFLNTSIIEEFDLFLPITGAVAITMPSSIRMMKSEKDSGRWNDATRVLTLTGVTATYFKLVFSKCDSVYTLEASDYYL